MGAQPVIRLDFNSTLLVDTVENSWPTVIPYCILYSSANISDTFGNLQFLNGGFILYDKNGYAMENGILVNCPEGNVLGTHEGMSPFPQTSIILPKAGNQYYVFNVGMSDSVANNYINHIYSEFDVLSYCVVDMDSNQGKGKVIVKDKVLSDKQHYSSTSLTATKHANGKDWWLVKADCYANTFQEFLVREDSILGPFYQSIPVLGDFCYNGWATIRFNNQGNVLASGLYGTIENGLYNRNRVDLYHFDRCDGSLNFKQYYMTPMDTASYWDWDRKADICFSANDSLLYMSNDYTIYQIDLQDTAIYNAQLIHGPDTTLDYFPKYDLMGLAPDGKIYIGNWHAIRGSMSYIDKPNIKGLGCDFKPQGFQQSYNKNLQTPPNNPNYGLGKDSTKICWPLQNENEYEEENEWVVYPNPTSGKLYIRYHTAWRVAVLKQLYNSVGQLMLQTKEDELDVSHLPKGVYYLHCGNAVRKVVVE